MAPQTTTSDGRPDDQTIEIMQAFGVHDDIDATNIAAEERSDGAIDTWFDVTFEMPMWTPPLSEVEQVAQDHGFVVVSVGVKESGRDRISVTLTPA